MTLPVELELECGMGCTQLGGEFSAGDGNHSSGESRMRLRQGTDGQMDLFQGLPGLHRVETRFEC